MLDNSVATLKILLNPRFRRDVKAFKITKIMFPYYAWQFLKEMEITTLLEKGSTIEEIMKKKSLRNKYFLEAILDILVGANVLKYENGRYLYISPPKDYSGKDKAFLEGYYPYSVKWTEKLISKAKNVLISGKKAEDTGFDEEEILDLWDGIMEESPYSFRNLAIKEMLKSLKSGAYILNVGCGGGIDIERILLNTNKSVNIVALDMSDKYIRRAKKRMEKLYSKAESDTLKNNINAIKYVKANILENNLKGYKFDGIFMSLVLNHIPREKLPELIKKLSHILNEHGKLSIFQLLNISKVERVPIWVMHVVPSHYEYPYRDEYLKILNENFAHVKTLANSNIIIAER